MTDTNEMIDPYDPKTYQDVDLQESDSIGEEASQVDDPLLLGRHEVLRRQ